MYPAPFEYVRVRGWDEAIDRLTTQADQEVKVLAGGQSLVPMMALRLVRPSCLVDINEIPFGDIRVEDGRVVVPALVRHAGLERSEALQRHLPILAEAASLIGNIRIRHRGTIGGSLAHAESSAELPCAAVAVGADVLTVGPDGERSIPAGEFFRGYFTTALDPAELVREIRAPMFTPGTGWAFVEFVRRAGDFALVEVAALIEMDEGRTTCVRAEVVVGGVADRPLRMQETAAAVVGTGLDQASIAEAAEVAKGAVEPSGNEYASADYRRHLVRVLSRRALTLAAARAGVTASGTIP